MTYNEWKDELKSNLLCVSEAERRRVLDYYAEAYADRREAGFSEREIIEDFGAPYDAAQRILYDTPETFAASDKAGSYSGSGYLYDRQQRREEERREREQRKMEREREREREREERQRERDERERERNERERERNERERARYSGESKSVGGNGYNADTNGYGAGGSYNRSDNGYNRPNEAYNGGGYNGNAYSGNYNNVGNVNPEPKRKRNIVLIIVLCILFAVPGIGLLCGILGGAIGFIAAPFAMIVGGGASVGAGVGLLVSGHIGEGLSTLGGGMVVFGLGLLIIPLLRGFVKFCIRMFKKLVKWLKNLFNENRRTV